MEVTASKMPGGRSAVVPRDENLADMRQLIEMISRGNREALSKLLGIIKSAESQELGILEARASRVIHGKTILHEIWCVIQTSGLGRDDRYRLLDFLDRHRFRMRNENLKWALSNCSNC